MSMVNKTSFNEIYRSQDADYYGNYDICVGHQLLNGGAITVLDRMTGFGYRDIETGYRSPCGQFWLASGNVDIREHLSEFNTEEQMIQFVIERANNCTGGHLNRCPAQSYRIFKPEQDNT